MFSQKIGIKMTHVPYKGTGPATTALLAGEDSDQVTVGVVDLGRRARVADLVDPDVGDLHEDVDLVLRAGQSAGAPLDS